MTAVVLFILAFAALLMISCSAHAQNGGGSAGGDPNDYSCSMINGIRTCVDPPQIGFTKKICADDLMTGKQTCINQGIGGGPLGAGFALGKGLGVVKQAGAAVASSGWLSKMTHWFSSLTHGFFGAIAQLLHDLVTFVLSTILDLVSMAINSISPPDFISSYSLGSLLGNTGSIVGFFMSQLQIPAGLGMLGSAYAFRLLRKFVTLFQW